MLNISTRINRIQTSQPFRLETWGFRLWEGKKPGDFRENLEIHAVMGKSIPDWNVWKLCGEDFENLIVNI